jgi:DNA polymerase
LGFNLQNMPRPLKEVGKKLDLAVDLVKKKDLENLCKQFTTEPLDVIGSLVRSCFIAKIGHKLLICDLASIEPRSLGWGAKANSILEVFRTGKDPYLNFAAALYNRTYEELKQAFDAGSSEVKEMRQTSKPGYLGCGYGLSGGDIIQSEEGDLVKTGLLGYAAAMGIELTKEMSDKSVQVYRDTHWEVVQFWRDIENAAMKCVQTKQPQSFNYVKFKMVENVLCLTLPSGRDLHYVDPIIVQREWFGKTKKTLEVFGMNQATHSWGRIFTFGSRLTENWVQAVSRDVLLSGLVNSEKIGLPCVLHCHDEICSEVPINSILGIKDLKSCMVKMPFWGDADLLLGAEGYESLIYKKE